MKSVVFLLAAVPAFAALHPALHPTTAGGNTAASKLDTPSAVAFMRQMMDEDGYVFMQKTDIASPMDFSKWWHTLYPREQFNYATGAFVGRKEIAPGVYKVTGESPDQVVFPHIEAAYSADPPQYMAISCLAPTADGTGTTLSSSSRIHRAVQRRMPSLYSAIKEVGVTYTTFYPPHRSPLGELFAAHFHPTALRFANQSQEEIVQALRNDRPGAKVAFGEDGSITCEWTLPGVQPAPTGSKWASSIPLAHKNAYRYAGNQSPWSVRIGDRPVTDAEYEELKTIHTEQVVTFDWQPGSMLIYSNIDYHHGRAAIRPELSHGRDCMVAYAGCVPWARNSCGGREKALRQDLALAHRLSDRHGITESIWTHMTAKLRDNTVLMTPFGVDYKEVNASALLSLDLTTGESSVPSRHMHSLMNPTALPLHRAVYAGCHECLVSIHAHHPALSVISGLDEGFMAVDQGFFSLVPIYYFGSSHMLSTTWDEHEEHRLAAAINRTSSGLVVLHNHGVIAFDTTVGAAYSRIWYAVRVAEIQIKLMSARSNPSAPLRTFNVEEVMANTKITSLYQQLDLQFEAWRRVELQMSDTFMY